MLYSAILAKVSTWYILRILSRFRNHKRTSLWEKQRGFANYCIGPNPPPSLPRAKESEINCLCVKLGPGYGFIWCFISGCNRKRTFFEEIRKIYFKNVNLCKLFFFSLHTNIARKSESWRACAARLFTVHTKTTIHLSFVLILSILPLFSVDECSKYLAKAEDGVHCIGETLPEACQVSRPV
jgi:hypothetical protein